MQLTTYLLVRDHEKTIEQTLKSIIPLKSRIIAGDNGCTDRSIDICRQYGAEIRKIPITNNNSDDKNKLMKEEGWLFWIEPWEQLVKGHKNILEALNVNNNSFRLQILQGHIINKEIRLWHSKMGLKFSNPIYESVDESKSKFLNAVITSKPKNNIAEQIKVLDKWKLNRPTDSEPYYYQSFILLSQGRYKDFLNSAKQFVFSGATGQTVIMTKYYMALVQLYVDKDAGLAIRNILPCLAVMPLMAEFWCLLGDIYYQKKQYQKAISFYENAIMLGARRLKNDSWPLEIPKYQEYPQKMIASCKNIIKETKIYKIR